MNHHVIFLPSSRRMNKSNIPKIWTIFHNLRSKMWQVGKLQTTMGENILFNVMI